MRRRRGSSIDPVRDLRRRNVIAKERNPLQDADRHRASTAAISAASSTRPSISPIGASFAARRSDAEKRGKLRGIGCAVFFEPSGGGGVPKDQVAIRFES